VTCVVLATGQSVNQAVADRVRHLPTVAVNDAFRLAPWAQALVACDANWWRKTPGALAFPGERWCASAIEGCARITARAGIGNGTNSGLLGLDYWVRRGAKRILLLGIDMQGTHYFGRHEEFKNTEPGRFRIFLWQFQKYAETIPADVAVLNCSPISALDVFPKVALDEALDELVVA
jgi:hypothetical protein